MSEFNLTADEITRYIPRDGLSVDDAKLSGVEDFIVDARRAKVNIKLLKNNEAFNNQIIELLTDKNNLMSDGMETVQKQSLLFSQQLLEQEFADSNFWKLAFERPELQTWESDQQDTGQFYIQSIPLLETVYAMFKNGLYKKLSFGQWTAPLEYSGYNAKFGYSLRNLFAFIGRGIQIKNGLPADDDTNIGLLFKDYLNEIYGGLGDDIAAYMLTFGVNINQMFTTQWVGNTTALAFFACIGQWLEANHNSGGYDIYFHFPHGTQIRPSATNNYYNMAMFVCSIIQYEWYQQVKTEFFVNGMQKLYMTNCFGSASSAAMPSWIATFGRWHYIPFLESPELVLRYPFNIYTDNMSDIIQNVFILKTSYDKQIECISHKVNDINIGKVRLATITNNDGTNESGMQVSQNWTTALTEQFNPVYRYYKLTGSNTEYYFYLDNIKFNQIFSEDNDNVFCLAQYKETNWIYFDRITCHEDLLDPSLTGYVVPEGSSFGWTENIPIYNEESGDETDNYGLYIYRDFFDKYYVKNKSNLLDVYGEITLDNGRVYNGLVDFNSVQIDRDQISFDLVDSIGVTIENLKKLESFVEFSQFDTGGDGTEANLKAGTNLQQFINAMIKTPFPYSHDLINPAFDIGSNPGLTNKVLDSLSAEDAFITGIQCSKSLLFTNEQGLPDISTDILDYGSEKTIDGEIISVSTSQQVSSETFNIDKLKNLAGYQRFTPEIVKFYMQTRNNYSVQKTMQIYEQQTNINLLDRITYQGKVYIVINKNTDLRNRMLKLTLIGAA